MRLKSSGENVQGAVQEQSATTTEIGRNVHESAGNSQRVQASVQDLRNSVRLAAD